MLVTGKRLHILKGKVVEEFGVYTAEVGYCKKSWIKDSGKKANKLMCKGEKDDQR